MLAEISVIPLGSGISVSDKIAKVADLIDESGLDYRINPMGTVLEGDLDSLMEIIRKCHGLIMKEADRVIINVMFDDRKDKPEPRLDTKLGSVLNKAKRNIKCCDHQ